MTRTLERTHRPEPAHPAASPQPQNFGLHRLAIGPVDDPHERAADDAAARVMRGSRIGPLGGALRRLQRACAACQDEEVRRAADGPAPAIAPASVHEVLARPGVPLDTGARHFFEPRFGWQFQGVRVHADEPAARSAQAIGARAFTLGDNIVFGGGQYQPNTETGRQLLAHELAHVVQQRDGDRGLIRRVADKSNPPAVSPCTVDIGAGVPQGTHVRFARNDRTLNPDQDELVAAEAQAWDARGRGDTFTVHGFASSDGDAAPNWDLACERALVVQAALTARGVPRASVAVVTHGETEAYGPAPEDNRRAVIEVMPAIAPTPATGCPATITENTTLTRDCAGGIVIRTSGVILDCAGHTLTGGGAGSGNGIRVQGATGVRVVNCRVTNFDEGLRLRDAHAGVYVNNQSFANQVDGIDLDDSNRNVFIQNRFADNLDHGVEFDGSTDNLFIGNTVTGNVDGIDTEGPPRTGAPAPDNTFLHNTCVGNTGSGIRLLSNNNTVRGNTCDGNSEAGIELDGQGNAVSGNRCTGNTQDGVEILDDGNTITGNTATGNQRDGFRIRGDNNILTRNTASGNASDDLDVGRGTTGSICTGNTFAAVNGTCRPDFP